MGRSRGTELGTKSPMRDKPRQIIIDMQEDSEGSLPRAQTHPAMSMSDDMLSSMHRSDSIASLRAFAHLIDARTNYYEEARKSAEELSRIKNSDVRAFYEEQNELLDGWREVHEVLESQFPTEIMRRFAMPLPHRARVRSVLGAVDEMCVGDDEQTSTDDENDSNWAHPFSQHAARRPRRISDRALTSLSGFFSREPGVARHGSRADLATDLDELSRSVNVAEMIRDRASLADVLEQPEPNEDDDDGLVLTRTKSQLRGPPRRSHSTLQRLLSEHPPSMSSSPSPYGTLSPRSNSPKRDASVTPAPPAPESKSEPPAISTERTPLQASEARRAPAEVWTKADNDRHQLLQNVPTHQRKQDQDQFVRLYINGTCLI